MTFHKSFRFRIFLSLWVFGILLVILFTMMAIFFSTIPSGISRQIYSEMRYEWESFTNNYTSNLNTPLPQSRFIRSYTDIFDLPSDLQEKASGIDAGYYNLTIPDKENTYEQYIAVQDHPDQVSRVYMLYDYSRVVEESKVNFKNRAFRRFSLAFIIIAVLAVLIGFLSSKKIIAPLNKLSLLVKSSDPENLPVNLSKDFPENEIGSLAVSFETAMQRIRDFIEREKSFSRDTSHELRTPVSTIKGAVELMREIPESSDKKIDRLLQRIERSLKNMEVTIESFLWLGRESQISDEAQITNIKDVVDESVQENRYLLQEKHVSINIKIEDDSLIHAPDAILKMAVVNLIRNAFYYTQKGEITIFSNDEYFEIKDTGIGIEPEDLKNITTPHIKGEHSKGFGLGLAIVERLCKRFNWLMDISSDPTAGTKVKIIFS